MEASDIRVTRWRRYGHDRLYAERADGVKVGWWDLAADEAHPELPELLPTLTAAVAKWKAEQDPRMVPRSLEPEVAETGVAFAAATEDMPRGSRSRAHLRYARPVPSAGKLGRLRRRSLGWT